MEGGDGFYLDESVAVTEDGDPEQGAGHVVHTEVPTDHVPRRNEVVPVVAGDVDRSLDRAGEVGTGCRQRGPQVRHHPFGLPGRVTDRDGRAGLVERTGAGGEHNYRASDATAA
jgi:hypothetical protein